MENRAPLSRNEVVAYLQQNIDYNAKRWGASSFWADQAREIYEKKLAKFDAGEVVSVLSESYVKEYGNGLGNYTDELHSDGTVHTYCYGYLD